MGIDVHSTMIIRRLIKKNKQGHVLSIGKTGTGCEIKLGSKKTFNPVVKK
jgi:molybdopterin/thiamine biosynthesis adenylyltransferase